MEVLTKEIRAEKQTEILPKIVYSISMLPDRQRNTDLFKEDSCNFTNMTSSFSPSTSHHRQTKTKPTAMLLANERATYPFSSHMCLSKSQPLSSTPKQAKPTRILKHITGPALRLLHANHLF